jgi:hypothetical protein
MSKGLSEDVKGVIRRCQRGYQKMSKGLSNILKIAELDCCQIIILSIYVLSTHAYAHVLRLSLYLPYEKR